MTERAPKLTLTYYKFSASADTLRLAAAIGKIPFKNKAIEKKEWKPPPGKEVDPRYNLPVLEIEVKGKEKQVISQRNAILNYLGRRGGLYPADPLEGLQVEYMIDAVSEALKPLEVSATGAVDSLLSESPWTDEEFLKIREKIASDPSAGLPHYLSFFERALRENGENNGSKWLVGKSVSIADLKLNQLVCWISGGIGEGDGPSLLKGIETSLVENYPLLLKHKMQIETLPEVLSWRAKYLPPYSVFEYRPPFEFRTIGRRTRLGEANYSPMHPTTDGRSDAEPRGKWSATTFPRLTLSYFETSARAEPIRLAAAIGKVPFTNRVIAKEDWAMVKRHSPLGQLPTLLAVQPGKDLVTAPQSTAILRYIGKLGGLYPFDEVESAQVEFMIETIVEATRLVEMTVSGVVKLLILDVLKKEEEIPPIRKRLLENEDRGLPKYLKYFESVLEENKLAGWLVGSNMTVADLSVYHLSSWLNGGLDGGVQGGDAYMFDSSILEKYPLLRKHREAIENHISVVRFREQFQSPYSSFDFVPYDDSESSGNQLSDNLPRGARRRLSADHLPKNVARSKSSDHLPRHPGFSAPSPAKRRSSKDDNEPSQPAKKTDKMMSAPLRRKPSFDSDEAEEELPRRKSRGMSLPPRTRPIIIDDDEDDDLGFSDESEDSEDQPGASYLLNLGSKKANELFDDSSTDSFDDEASTTSVEHGLEGLKNRLQSALEKEKELSSSDPTARKKKADKKKKHKKKKDKKKKKKKSKRESDTMVPPKLPPNTPRASSTKKSSEKSLSKATGKPKEDDTEPKSGKSSSSRTEASKEGSSKAKDKDEEGKTSKTKSSSTSEKSSKQKSQKPSSKENTPKRQKKVKRHLSGSPKGTKRFPSNNPRESMKSSFKVEGLENLEGLEDEEEEAPDYLQNPTEGIVTPVPQSLKERPEVFRGDSLRSLLTGIEEEEDSDDDPSPKKKRPLVFYFSTPGRAESIRLAAVIGHIPFSNLSAGKGDTAYKHMAPLGQLPVLEIEEAHNRRLIVPQSMAILRYLGHLGQVYPDDPMERLLVDSMCDCVGDVLRMIELTCRASSRSILEFKAFTDEECVSMRQRMVEDEANGIRSFLSFFERELEQNFSRYGGWIAQNKLTIADLRLYQLLCWLGGSFEACLNGNSLVGIPGDILQGHPLLELHKERVEEIKEVSQFRSQCPHPYESFTSPTGADTGSDGVGPRREKPAVAKIEPSKLPRFTLTHAENTPNTQPLRLAAALGKIPFTNKVIDTDSQEWRNVYERRVKESQLPVLEIEESGEKKLVSQPMAILRYLGTLGDMYPHNSIRALEVESMIETIIEIQNLISIPSDETIQRFMSGNAWTENETWSVRRRIAKNKGQGLPFYLAYFEKAISDNPDSHWLVGPKVTIADLCLYNFLDSIISGAKLQEQAMDLHSSANNLMADGFSESLLEEYPILKSHKERVEGLEPVISFQSKFSPPYKTFAFRPA
ncbi:S-crystallin [Seminavis robusta]|uniref:S-crystallin n=1 Tax=Seminavis robusta TaxID=568900 RepID=A0A9N8DSU9_9STRA|nr:S-crystallin [Seminavis robusta]|eukprot:Sro256_g100680.1 S-crystallin (1475) ;mRNA; r:49967-55021